MFASGLDAFFPSPYLSPAMNRFLLTLLALLTGFAAQVSPAQAALRGVDETEVGSVQTVHSVRLAQQIAVGDIRQSVAFEGVLGKAASLLRLHVAAPAVRIGIDRARE